MKPDTDEKLMQNILDKSVLREARHMYFKEQTLAIWLCKQNEVLAVDYLSWNGYTDNEL